jgi:hypothetical protein
MCTQTCGSQGIEITLKSHLAPRLKQKEIREHASRQDAQGQLAQVYAHVKLGETVLNKLRHHPIEDRGN